MRLNNVQLFGIIISCLLLGLVGCDSSRETNPIFPGESAVLVISFSPSPVHETSDGKFRFTVFVDEVNNVGATITSVKLESFDESGDDLDIDRHDEEWVRQTFGSSYIEPFGRLIASVKLEARFSHHENWILRGTDDQDNRFEFAQSVELIDR